MEEASEVASEEKEDSEADIEVAEEQSEMAKVHTEA